MSRVTTPILTEGLPSHPHVDHDPLHHASYAEEHGQEPVVPQTAFTRHQTEDIRNVDLLHKHLL